MLAAANASDIVVLCAALLGVLIVVIGLATFDGRLRARMPLPSTIRDRVIGRIGLVIGGILLVSLALG